MSTANGHVIGKSKKLFRLKSGGMVATAGDADARNLVSLLDNVKDENDLPSKAELEALRVGGEYILVLPDKSAWYIDVAVDEETKQYKAQVYPTGSKQAVNGHGFAYARGALDAGKDAVEAVRIACKNDSSCALPVQTMRLEDKPKEKIKRVRQPKPVQQEAE